MRQKARELAGCVYRLTASAGFSCDYPLRDQIRRAAISVPSNIAEGFERGGRSEFVHFLSVAKGSAGEVRAQLYLALDQGYITEDDLESARLLAENAAAMISGLMRYLKRSPFKGDKFRATESSSPTATLNLKP